jgi:transposase-like protein
VGREQRLREDVVERADAEQGDDDRLVDRLADLPGLREVAAQLGVNHNTVRAAVAKLEADGVLETRHGAGTFVAAGAGGDATTGHAELLGDVTQRAQAAGVAPRALAAALYVAGPEAGAADAAAGVAAGDTARAGAEAAAERRALREELAVLDRIACDLEARLSTRLPAEPAPEGLARGPRLLSGQELRAQRGAPAARRAPARRPPSRARYTSEHADRPRRTRVGGLGA